MTSVPLQAKHRIMVSPTSVLFSFLLASLHSMRIQGTWSMIYRTRMEILSPMYLGLLAPIFISNMFFSSWTSRLAFGQIQSVFILSFQ